MDTCDTWMDVGPADEPPGDAPAPTAAAAQPKVRPFFVPKGPTASTIPVTAGHRLNRGSGACHARGLAAMEGVTPDLSPLGSLGSGGVPGPPPWPQDATKPSPPPPPPQSGSNAGASTASGQSSGGASGSNAGTSTAAGTGTGGTPPEWYELSTKGVPRIRVRRDVAVRMYHPEHDWYQMTAGINGYQDVVWTPPPSPPPGGHPAGSIWTMSPPGGDPEAPGG